MSNKTEKELLLDLSGKVNNIDKTLTRQETTLKEHIRRTEVMEDRLEIFEERIEPALDAYKFIATLLKFIVPIATIVGIWYQIK